MTNVLLIKYASVLLVIDIKVIVSYTLDILQIW